METILVTGANRGIGLEFCNQFAKSGFCVIACCRRPEKASELTRLARQYSAIRILTVDVADGDSINQLASELSNTSIDILINNAGVYGDDRSLGFGRLDYQHWLDVLTVNTLAPVRITEALLPNLVDGNKKLIVAITSKMGSIADNSSGGAIFYRTSKTALNMAMKSLSLDLASQGIGVMILHPGWVRTDMGGPHALITTQQSVQGMLSLIHNFTLQDSGKFLDYSGKVISW